MSSIECCDVLGVLNLDDVPSILGSMAEFTASYTGGKTVVAYGDLLVDHIVRKIIRSFSHSSNKDADTLVFVQVFNVFPDTNNLRFEAQSDLSTVGRKVVGNWVCDHFEELLLGVDRSNGEAVEKLDHQTCKSFEGTWNTNCWADFNENTLGRVYINLKPASLVDWGIEEGQKTLMCNIWSSVTDIAVRLSHDTNVFVGVEKSIFLVAIAILSGAYSLECLETCIGKDDNEALGRFISGGDGHMLLCDKLWQRWWRE